jgi:putative ABC transport system ATP-binding protein
VTTATSSMSAADSVGSLPTLAVIDVRDISKVFVTDEIETHALSEVSFSIQKGEYVAISGPSGCGKTTLLSILGLLDTVTTGTYMLDGLNVSELSHHDRSRARSLKIGFVFQSFNLIGDRTVFENVELPLQYRTGSDAISRSDREQRVRDALDRVGVLHRARHYPSQLSGGQQQRVAVARAVAMEPAVLLADEPTGNLDSANSNSVMSLLRELHQDGATLCIVTHDPRYADYAERTIHLFDGQLVSPHVASQGAR